jgi:hypothetical protein
MAADALAPEWRGEAIGVGKELHFPSSKIALTAEELNNAMPKMNHLEEK